jgi:hypothetical protein
VVRQVGKKMIVALNGIVSFKNSYGNTESVKSTCCWIDTNCPDTQIIWNGELYLLHNESGPAIMRDDGINKWFLDGVEYSKVQWLNKLGK